LSISKHFILLKSSGASSKMSIGVVSSPLFPDLVKLLIDTPFF
jgi:hypothetical protein